MENIKTTWVRKIFKILKWTFLVLICLFIVACVWRGIYLSNKKKEQAKTDAEVEKIHNTKLTLADVMGTNLPPDPGALADQTIAGVDANNNGIRDDVELAIFNAYPKSAKTRAVLLQLALAMEMENKQSFINSEIVDAVLDKEDSAIFCSADLIPGDGATESRIFLTTNRYLRTLAKEQYNTDSRIQAEKKFISYSKSKTELTPFCDIDLSTLSN
ncbi:MAG: hypothetical protein P4L63_00775 [Candidatus Pacebacteria bacterium]|nr:hypothetical protein [Candidatus Paceibacterota bacterium]